MKQIIRNKKGQLTIFIIIGIVMLFSAALIIFIRQNVTQYKPPVEITTEQVPAEMQPLQQYITDCLTIIAKEALIKAGMQGGYIDTSSLMINDMIPTEAQGISMAPGSAIKIPYWYHMKSSNSCEEKCEFTSEKLSLYRSGFGNSVEKQIDKYVEERLSSCLGDFSEFKAQGYEIKQSTIKAITTIAKTDVFVQVDYPLAVTAEGRSSELSRFSTKISLNLGKLYALAEELTQKEVRTSFLENMMINLVDSYAGISEDRLPPLADTDFLRGSTVTWLARNVKSKIEELFMIYIPALQTTGTSNFQGNYYNNENPLAKGIYSFFILPLNKTYAANSEFSYLSWWPTYLKITPSSGEIIRPNTASGFDSVISFLGITQYKFAYDLSAPVLITLTDPSAMDGTGYTFQFAIESNIRNNLYMTPDTVLFSVSTVSKRTLACNLENYNSGEVTVEVIDSVTKEPIDNADVSFSFGKEACYIGQTKLTESSSNKITGAAVTSFNKKAVIVSKMPVGIGTLLVSKENYITKVVPFAAKLDDKQKIIIELDRYVELNISVVRIPFLKHAVSSDQYDWVPTPEVPDLESTQSVLITLVRNSESPAQENVGASFELKGSGSRTSVVRIVPGTYRISGNLFDNQLTIVPEDEVCYPDDFWDTVGLGNEKCETVPQINFDSFPKGGVILDSVSFTGNMLKGKTKLVIKLFETPAGYTRAANGMTNLLHNDLEQTGKYEEYSKIYADNVQPVLS